LGSPPDRARSAATDHRPPVSVADGPTYSVLQCPPPRLPAAAPGSCHSADSGSPPRSSIPILAPLPPLGASVPRHTRGPKAERRSWLAFPPACLPALSASPTTGRSWPTSVLVRGTA